MLRCIVTLAVLVWSSQVSVLPGGRLGQSCSFPLELTAPRPVWLQEFWALSPAGTYRLFLMGLGRAAALYQSQKNTELHRPHSLTFCCSPPAVTCCQLLFPPATGFSLPSDACGQELLHIRHVEEPRCQHSCQEYHHFLNHFIPPSNNLTCAPIQNCWNISCCLCSG